MKTMTAQQLAKQLTDGSIDLIDVRTPAEFRSIHVRGARNVPYERFDAKSIAERHNPAQPLYVICHSGTRSDKACQDLVAAGISEVIHVEGGTAACEKAGIEVVRGRKFISLERQIRIAAGLLIVTGVGLAYFVHPGFVGLSAFVGAGLVFAGVTDTCAMGMILARMPWNQGQPINGSCAID